MSAEEYVSPSVGMPAKRRRRNCVVVATAIEVQCPECGEAVPSPEEESLFWTVEQLKQHDGKRVDCGSCDQPLTILMQSKAAVF